MALMKDFVSYNLGADTLSRKDWLSHNTFISKQLLESKDDQLILVSDGEFSYETIKYI